MTDGQPDMLLSQPETQVPDAVYQVLARKYRPATFAQLIGQDALVRTLSNAIASGRLAHAWLLTGVRGVGKTSTARLIAKALNCVGPDGTGGPTITPCGACEFCVAITASRHIDVIEMDAASRTGVDDVREIIEAVRYAAVSARFKVYIIDEVHMLSKNAFNALLKTLEEPPPHVKFIFATTEIRKVPVTVLSRCQRFDLRRVPPEVLSNHFAGILAKEGAEADADALSLIARAAEGSVRDGLSILDQAIAHSSGRLEAQAVREMLGLADASLTGELFADLVAADAGAVVAGFRRQYDAGLDPVTLFQDLLALVHELTIAKTAASSGSRRAGSALVSDSLKDVGAALSFAQLHRLWQLLLKGLDEVQRAPNAAQAAEMGLLRLVHAAHLPDPEALARLLEEKSDGAKAGSAAPRPDTASRSGATALADNVVSISRDRSGEAMTAADTPAGAVNSLPQDFIALVDLFETKGEWLLGKQLRDDVHLVRYAAPDIELRLRPSAPADLVRAVAGHLTTWTGVQWTCRASQADGDATLQAQAEADKQALRAAAGAHPLVQAVQARFPGAQLMDVELFASQAGTQEQSRPAQPRSGTGGS